MSEDIVKELEALYQLGEPIIPFWDQSLFDPPTASAKVEELGTQTTHLRELHGCSLSHSAANLQCTRGNTKKRIPTSEA